MEPIEIPLSIAVMVGERILDNALGKLLQKQSLKKNIEKPLLFINHRRHFKDRFFLSALESNEKILLLSIMSKHTLVDVNELKKKNKLKARQLRILTFTPQKTATALYYSLAAHLDEYPVSNVKQQIKNAWEGWRKLEKESKSTIKVRGYSSFPTVQGILVENKYAMIEILSFHTQPDNRMSVLITKKDCPKAFALIADSFETLWTSSKDKKQPNPRLSPTASLNRS